jgi:hypothetical protein
MTWQEFLLRLLESEAVIAFVLAAIGAAGTWVIRRLKLSEQQRQQAEDALRGGVEWVWENRARIAKREGLKLSPEQREEFRRMATNYARELARDKGVDLDKVLMSEEVINGIIHEIISARRQGESGKLGAPLPAAVITDEDSLAQRVLEKIAGIKSNRGEG